MAASFSQTYKRNALNNGLRVIDSPALYEALRARLAGRNEPTVEGPMITIDFRASQITMEGEAFSFSPLSVVAQELIVAGGAENLVRSRIAG